MTSYVLLPTARSVLNVLVKHSRSYFWLSGTGMSWQGLYSSIGEQLSPLKTQQSYTIILEGNKGKFGKDLLNFINLPDKYCPLKVSS